MRTAEADVGDGLGNADLPDQRAVEFEAMHAVARRGPQAAGLVDAEPVEDAGVADREYLAARQRPAVDDVEGADVARPVGFVGRPESAM